MSVQLLAKRYAQAVFDLAIENKEIDRVATDLKLVNTVLEENRTLRKVLANPVLDSSKKVKVLIALFGVDNRISKLTLLFLQLITKKGREVYVQDICNAFETLYLDYNNEVKAKLITSYKVDSAFKNKITSKLVDMIKKNVLLEEEIDEQIIGGFIMQIEDYQYDASVVNQLRKLKNNFNKNLFVKQY